jgi:hypothetical protein
MHEESLPLHWVSNENRLLCTGIHSFGTEPRECSVLSGSVSEIFTLVHNLRIEFVDLLLERSVGVGGGKLRLVPAARVPVSRERRSG